MWVLLLLGLIYAGFCAYLYVAQRSFIYFPVPETPNGVANDLRLDVRGATLQIWQLQAEKQEALIYFGGNAEDVSQNIQQFVGLFPEKAIYLVNYRGYGASTGIPTEAALIEDARIIFDHVSQSHTGISIIGRSLGSGVAMALAAEKTPERLVLITPFDSMVRLAQSSFPIFPVSFLLKDRYDSLSYAGSISMPTLLLIAERDEFIPIQHSKNLAAAIEPSTVTVIEDATHNTIQDYDRYAHSLGGFLQ